MSAHGNGLVDWSEQVLGHSFAAPSLLEEALTHTTYANERPACRSNQRLEFLGDAVVGMTMAEHLYKKYPHLPEGELTKLRAAVVCEPTLAARARSLRVGERMRFGRGEESTGPDRESILADAFEALAGAIYLDSGWEAAQRFVLRELGHLVPEARKGLVRVDYKTRLQELLQRTHNEAPAYRLHEEEGPAHSRRFQVGVYHRNALLGTGSGRSKKEAEQEAARQGLLSLGADT